MPGNQKMSVDDILSFIVGENPELSNEEFKDELRKNFSDQGYMDNTLKEIQTQMAEARAQQEMGFTGQLFVENRLTKFSDGIHKGAESRMNVSNSVALDWFVVLCILLIATSWYFDSKSLILLGIVLPFKLFEDQYAEAVKKCGSLQDMKNKDPLFNDAKCRFQERLRSFFVVSDEYTALKDQQSSSALTNH